MNNRQPKRESSPEIMAGIVVLTLLVWAVIIGVMLGRLWH